MIRLLIHLLRDESAASATELALAIPLLLLLIIGPLEVGNYFMDEHVLVKGVRDGAIYAAHQDITNFNCGSNTVSQTVIDNTKAIVRTGQLSGGTDRLPNWASGSTTFSVTLRCVTQATNGTTLSGIYKINNGQVPIVKVTASVPYAAVLKNLGFRAASLTITASQEATVMGL